MKSFSGIGLIFLGLVLVFVGMQASDFNAVTGQYEWRVALDNPVALVAGVVAVAVGLGLVTGWPRRRGPPDGRR